LQLLRFRDKGLRQIYEDGSATGVLPAMALKVRNLAGFPDGGCILKGALKRFWSLSVTED